MSSGDGLGCLSSMALQATTKPGVQNPHCEASLSTKACCKGWSLPPSISDSTVVIFFPCASIARTEQAYTALPSIKTVQAPHSARSQTRLAPVMSMVSRRASSNVTRGSSEALYDFPFTLNCIGTLPGPCTGTCSPAAMTRLGLATIGTAAAMVEIFRKSRRDTPEFSSLVSFGSIRTDSSSCIPVLHAAGRVRPAVAGLCHPLTTWEAGENNTQKQLRG